MTTPSFAISACNLVTASEQLAPSGLATNYLTPAASVPHWLLRAPDRGRVEAISSGGWCWPDHPLLHAPNIVEAAR